MSSDPPPDPPPDFDRAPPVPVAAADFERRFLDYAFAAPRGTRMTSVSVAHALKLPIALCAEQLEALAAADPIHRDVDDAGAVFYTLPGQGQPGALVPHASSNALAHQRGASTGLRATLGGGGPPVPEAAALTGLVLNIGVPGLGSIIAGRPKVGLLQLGLLAVGLPLCFFVVGFPIVAATWIWAVATGYDALSQSKNSL